MPGIPDYVWGVKGNGEPIELTVDEYFSQYVYVHDFQMLK